MVIHCGLPDQAWVREKMLCVAGSGTKLVGGLLALLLRNLLSIVRHVTLSL